jgi:hypothetical protein
MENIEEIQDVLKEDFRKFADDAQERNDVFDKIHSQLLDDGNIKLADKLRNLQLAMDAITFDDSQIFKKYDEGLI